MSFDDSWREPSQTTRLTRVKERFNAYVELRRQGAPEEQQERALAQLTSYIRSCNIAACLDEAVEEIANMVADGRKDG